MVMNCHYNKTIVICIAGGRVRAVAINPPTGVLEARSMGMSLATV